MGKHFFKPETQDALKTLLTDVKSYFRSVSLIKAIESNLPELLAENELSLDEICAYYRWNSVATRLLCDTLVTMEWFEVNEAGVYRNSQKMLTLLPELPKLAPLVDDWSRGMVDMSTMPEFLLNDTWDSGKVSEKYSYTQGLATKEETANYSNAMLDSVEPMADSLIQTIDFSLFKKVLDVGGGYGLLAHYIKVGNPLIEWVGVFDLPLAEEGFKKLQNDQVLDPSLHFIPGDFFNSELNDAYDCITLNRILFDWNDEKAKKIVSMCQKALKPGGILIVHEGCYRLDFNRIAASWLHLLVGGRLRTCEEVRAVISENTELKIDSTLKSKIPDWYIFVASKSS
ncbi:methyltransferase [Alkalimarinus alittae]|uniref:Methyltransferase n=1 Tax=Alkalimarinus alittae TaxID=2961619 RepID=A0ABY6N6E9_9ALTE|nr:methyltransferase [Alkalimarinus alittae]UZE97552.1 methyltransferase [Alkalimarinus alittae]